LGGMASVMDSYSS